MSFSSVLMHLVLQQGRRIGQSCMRSVDGMHDWHLAWPRNAQVNLADLSPPNRLGLLLLERRRL